MKTRWLGRVAYVEVLEQQRAYREQVLAGRAKDTLWLVEHPAVLTTGRRSVGDLPAGLQVVHTERGGLATYHGPGQLVGYLICDVAARGGSVRGTVQALEQGIIDWLSVHDLHAVRRPGAPGVWLENDKVCALGLHFRRGVSMHGFAFNLRTDLSGFGGFTPCGIRDGGVTSVLEVRGNAPAPEQAWRSVASCVLSALRRSWAHAVRA